MRKFCMVAMVLIACLAAFSGCASRQTVQADPQRIIGEIMKVEYFSSDIILLTVRDRGDQVFYLALPTNSQNWRFLTKGFLGRTIDAYFDPSYISYEKSVTVVDRDGYIVSANVGFKKVLKFKFLSPQDDKPVNLVPVCPEFPKDNAFSPVH